MSNVFKTIIKSKPEIFIESDKHINKEREREREQNKIKKLQKFL